LAANALNEIITLAHENRLTRKQYIMFALADMITHLEIGVSLARKASKLTEAQSAEAEKITLMSKIFSNEASQLMMQNVPKILMGSGVFDEKKISDFIKAISYYQLLGSFHHLIGDMDRVADIIFER
jgi:alkylation response protein AidB-like acyl-CoA dehydrogenase